MTQIPDSTRIFHKDSQEAGELIKAQEWIAEEFEKHKNQIEELRKQSLDEYWKKINTILGDGLGSIEAKIGVEIDNRYKDEGIIIVSRHDIEQNAAIRV